jgi:hypothetical protein
VQEGKGEIRYQFRQCSVWGVSLRESVTMNFFKVFEYQVGMSAGFDPHTLGLGGESVAARLQESSPGGYLRESLLWGLRPRGPWFYMQKKVYCNVLI